MKTVEDIKQALEKLSPVERAEIEAWMAGGLAVAEPAAAYGTSAPQGPVVSHLTRIPGVRGGHAIVKNTRIGVHDVVAYFLLGSDVEAIRQRFPDLTRAQIYECLAYYEDHKTEIERLALDQVKDDNNEVLSRS